jgi:PKD repeat protein
MYNQKTDTLVITDIVQAYITSADTVSVGASIVFNADKTNLPGWEIGQFYWNFGHDQVAVGSEVTARYLNPGTYNVQLMVTSKPDADGETEETCVSKNIVVIRQP